MAQVEVPNTDGELFRHSDTGGLLFNRTKGRCATFSITILGCCGIKELHGLNGATAGLGGSAEVLKTLNRFMGKGKAFNCAFLLFSEVQPKSYAGGVYGQSFRDCILENGLGEVTETPEAINPNSNNAIKAYIWKINAPAFEAWATK